MPDSMKLVERTWVTEANEIFILYQTWRSR